MKHKTRRRDTHKTLLKLKQELPPAFPVVVRKWVKMPKDYYADIELAGRGSRRRFRISINEKLNDSEATESLKHEWAHALAWRHADDQRDSEDDPEWHGDVWGVCYARVYRACLAKPKGA
jgi:hypothetical protein